MTLRRNEDLTYTLTCACAASVTVGEPWAYGYSQAVAARWSAPFTRHSEQPDLCPTCRGEWEKRIDAELRAEGVDVDGLIADVEAIRARATGVGRPAGDA